MIIINKIPKQIMDGATSNQKITREILDRRLET